MNEGGVEIDTVSLSRSTVYRKRFRKIEMEGDKIRSDIVETLKGKRLCLHFDGKQVKQIEEDLGITVNVERIAVSVTSPDLPGTNDVLLGVVQASSSKGSDQVDVLLNMLYYYEIADNIYAVCCDTTASNTGAFAGAVKLLAVALDVPLLWFLCRRHILEVHISHFMTALTGEKTKGPRRELYSRLQKAWPVLKQSLDSLPDLGQLTRFDWATLQVGSPLYIIAREALEYGQRALAVGTFTRGDYRKMSI